MNLKLNIVTRAATKSCKILKRQFGGSSSVWSRKYGQPTEWTHGHIIGKDQVNKGILKTEFKQRRINLIENLQKKKTGSSILIIPSARKQFMIDKIPYFFRQDTDFRYLTGCLQPDNVLVIGNVSIKLATFGCSWKDF